MEDAHSVVLNLDPDGKKYIAWFAVFDGHGGKFFSLSILYRSWNRLLMTSGDRVAKYAGEHVHEIVRKQEAFTKGDFIKALEDGFLATDTALQEGNSTLCIEN